MSKTIQSSLICQQHRMDQPHDNQTFHQMLITSSFFSPTTQRVSILISILTKHNPTSSHLKTKMTTKLHPFKPDHQLNFTHISHPINRAKKLALKSKSTTWPHYRSSSHQFTNASVQSLASVSNAFMGAFKTNHTSYPRSHFHTSPIQLIGH